tara:strand:- start:280 stop:1188 length:909 start_codon:yes stop_codon:yes gene_type:complete
MNEKKAIEILEINRSFDKLNYKLVRKSYLKASLKYHPDKNFGNEEKFKEIVKAYEFLCDNLPTDHDNEKTEKNFDTLLEELIIKFYPPKNDWTQIFIKTTIKNILNKCETFSYKVFEKLEKNRAIEVYEFINKINDYGFINKETIEKIQQILKEKMKNDNIILLEPTLEDLLNDKIYKLDISDNEFYIPLWHNELYFDYKDNNIISDLIVKIEPELTTNIFIDHNNNIFYKKNINIKDLYENESIEIKICNKKFTLQSSDFKITKKNQIFKFENSGILKINDSNYFDNNKRADIIFELFLII